MADKIKFLAGKLADLKNKPKVQGQVYFAIDGETGKIAFDVDGQTRVFMDKASSADSATQDSAGNVISKYIKTIQLLSGDDTRFQYILGDGSYVPSKTTGIRLNFVSRAGDTMTGLLTAKGGILVNTATNTQDLIISRTGSAASECTSFGQDDQGLIIKSINDEASTYIRFDMEATDMEANAGAGANSGTITFGLSGGKTTVTADYFSGQASSAVKDTSGNTIASTFIKNLILNNHATQPYYQLVKGTGDNKSTVNLPVASTTNAGVVTVGAQSFKGQKTIVYDGTTTARKSSALILSSASSKPVGLEFWRGDGNGASWQVVNDSGNLIFRTDYNDALQTTYSVGSLQLHYTTGAAQAPYVWVNGANSGYRLYVNGSSYLTGNVLLGSTLTLNNNSYTANRMMWTDASKVAQASYHYVDSAKVGINYTSAPSTTFYVNGESTFNGNIILPVVNDDRFITFNYTGGDGYDWRIGYLGTGEGDGNYLVFQSAKTGTTFSNALRFGLTTLDAAFGGNIYPLNGSAGEQCLGTSSSRWPYIYGAIGNFSSTVTATTFMASTENALSTSGVMRIKSSSTMYLNRGASTSLIFQINGTGHARFDTAGHFIPEDSDTYNIGSSSKQWKNVYATTFNGILKTNNIVLQNAAAAQYGRLYIATEGTACATAGTAGTTGVAMLILGNSTAVSSTVGKGANNARGRIRLYGTGANYIQLQALPKTETNNYSFTLPPYEGDMYAAHTGSTDAVGSGVKPVYVGASGRITASSSTVGSGIKPIYLNAGALTVSSSTVGSGIIPVFLNAGTLTASTSTIGSGIKPMFLNAGTLTASSSTVGSGVVPMFLSSGTLTASTSTVGSGIKPIYLNAGTLTVSSSTVGTSDRPVYLSSGTISQTTYRMAATNTKADSGVDIGSTPQTGIWYVSGTSSILGQSDGVAIVNHYNSNWVSQIYQDYRSGQIALRGKNNGTWQAWRTVIDTGNYTTHLDGRYVNVTGDSMSGTLSWGGNIASLNLRAGHADYNGVISYQTSGNEAFLFTTKNTVTSFIFANGEDTITNMAADRWTKITPALQIKNNSVYIGSLIANGTTPAYKFYVNGTSYFNGVMTMAGLLTISTNGVSTTYGCQNGSYSHNSTTASTGHWFNKNVYVQGNIYAGASYADLVLTTANYATNIDGRYVNVTGDTMTGKLQVNAPIFGYNYSKSNNAAAFIFDKPGSNYTGIGANGSSDTIYFGACNTDGTWNTSYYQIWKFQGALTLETGAGVNNCTKNYISAGRGYSTGSGKNGLKLICTEQTDAISGIGQDCTGKEYELSVGAALGTSGQGYITFVGHKMASLNSYTELGHFNFATSTFYVNGKVGIGTASPGYTLQVNGSTCTHGLLACNRGTSTASSNYGDAAIEIREYNFGGAQSDSWGVAPRLSFHWGGRVTAQIGLASNGWLYAANSSNSGTAMSKIMLENGGTWGINISGNAATATAVKDRQTGTTTYLNYGASGLTSASWLAAWNGYELRAISPKVVQDLVQHSRKVTVDLSSLDNSKWYPVTGSGLASFGYNKIKVSVHLNSGTVPSWSTHAGGFTVNVELYTTASGWGTTGSETIVLNDSYQFANVHPVGYSQNGYNSTPVLWLRGGGKYFVETDFEVAWTVRTSTYYTYGSASDTTKQSVTPTTSYPGIQGVNGTIKAGRVWGAIWNDYAEFRKAETLEPGRVVVEDKWGEMKLSTERLQPGGNVISDTYGHVMGETAESKTPIAVSGRVLAYTYEDRESYPLGAAVCTGPNGTVSLMTREEIREYPERIIGTVSEIPEYETWGTGNVKVNGRIWIKVK